ncbi:hypothetical protein CMO92_01775 [Candidatus Woesearchaeota archaeon]|nr:hypothetical protein [Candidatus Woesearchaeota archaeon]
MSEDIFGRSEKLLKGVERLGKFGSRFNYYPYKEAGRMIDRMTGLASEIPSFDSPTTNEEVLQTELKRRLIGEASYLEQVLSGRRYDFDTVVSLHGIPFEDIAVLRPWLESHKDETLEGIERLFQTSDIESFELGLPVDIPSVRRQAEEFAAVHIQKYHKRIGRLLEELTEVGGFLRDIDAVPTTEARSYFHPLTKTLAIGIAAICYITEDESLHIRERDLITLYGHEGMGHALNDVVTVSNGLPYFLTHSTSLTKTTKESVAQFYEKQLFKDLRASPETQKALGIQHLFEEIYKEATDIDNLNKYSLRLYQYAITVLANKELGDPKDPVTTKKKIDLIREVTLDPTYPVNIVDHTRDKFDSEGNLSPQIVSELIYCAQPVQRALQEFRNSGSHYEGEGRSRIDRTLLTGFWTPLGFEQNALIEARKDK